jgi:hypothetical protein
MHTSGKKDGLREQASVGAVAGVGVGVVVEEREAIVSLGWPPYGIFSAGYKVTVQVTSGKRGAANTADSPSYVSKL